MILFIIIAHDLGVVVLGEVICPFRTSDYKNLLLSRARYCALYTGVPIQLLSGHAHFHQFLKKILFTCWPHKDFFFEFSRVTVTNPEIAFLKIYFLPVFTMTYYMHEYQCPQVQPIQQYHATCKSDKYNFLKFRSILLTTVDSVYDLCKKV